MFNFTSSPLSVKKLDKQSQQHFLLSFVYEYQDSRSF